MNVHSKEEPLDTSIHVRVKNSAKDMIRAEGGQSGNADACRSALPELAEGSSDAGEQYPNVF